MNWLFRLLSYFLRQRAKVEAVREVKRRGILAYLKFVQGSRRILILIIAISVIFQLMIWSLIGALITGVWLLDISSETKIQILFGAFMVLFGLPALALVILTSDRLWFKASGAQKMIQDFNPRGNRN